MPSPPPYRARSKTRKGADRRNQHSILLLVRVSEYERVMKNKPVGRAPNFTNACIFMFGVNLTWVLVVIWAIWGLLAAVLLGLSLNHLIDRGRVWAEARQAASIRRGKHI